MAFSGLEGPLILLAGLPIAALLYTATLYFLGITVSERHVSSIVATTLVVCLLLALGLGGVHAFTDRSLLVATAGTWFAAGHYRMDLSLRWDPLTFVVVVLTTVLTGLVGRFSVRYLHREPGFFRFFLLLQMFTSGMILIGVAGSLDVFLMGWELLGLSSALLIGFFPTRAAPAANSLWTFGVYRFGDVGLLVATLALHATLGSTRWEALSMDAGNLVTARLSEVGALVVGSGVLLAAQCKSAQFPFSGWIARAMEGPTPSSAIFYGALSIHAGPILLLRFHSLLQAAPQLSGWTATLGMISAIFATLIGRTQPDVKASTAYAAVGQVGLIFVEIGLGFPRLPIFHLIGHAALRTLQFLAAPSAIQQRGALEAALGGPLAPTGRHYGWLLSERLQTRLWRFALFGGHLDDILWRYLIGPLESWVRLLDDAERNWMDGSPGEPAPSPPRLLPESVESEETQCRCSRRSGPA